MALTKHKNKRYKWQCPHDWLKGYLHVCQDAGTLHEVAVRLASRLSDDTLQSMFEPNMEDDGYFEPIDKAARGDFCIVCGEDFEIGEKMHGSKHLRCEE